ncbi:MAG: CBS domain-containing protein [Firmicutes bacterium]|nr:CBS domain-containing protein [Bacillota bacterium]
MKQKLQDIMTQNVASVSPQQTVAQAAQIMSQYNVGVVPVVQNGKPVGMLTDRDITLRVSSNGQDANTTQVQSVMSNGVMSGTTDMDVHEASKLMAQNQIRRLPVTQNGQMAGIVSLGDLAVQNVYQNEAGQALTSISQPAKPQMQSGQQQQQQPQMY